MYRPGNRSTWNGEMSSSLGYWPPCPFSPPKNLEQWAMRNVPHIDDELAARLNCLCAGENPKDFPYWVGLKSRLGHLQAAVLKR
jgi:hypothetical protein